MTGWCFVCKREGVVLKQYRQTTGKLAEACADELACQKAHSAWLAEQPKRRRRGF